MMNKAGHRLTVTRRNVLNLGLGMIAFIGLVACGGAQSPTSAPTAAPSATSAPTAAPDATDTAPAAATETPAATTQAAEPTVAAEATAASTTTAETMPAVGGQAAVFQIDPARSKASFTLGETLMGNPKTVVGTTSKVSGVISATFDQPANTQMGVIQIDASDLSTDSDMRNRSIQRFILQTTQPEFQYITFEPTAIEGLPSKAVAAGDSFSFKVTGNLKIRNVVKPVTFDTTVTATSATELEGNAKANVTRGAFELNIPNVQSVADVTDEVALELQFVATKQ